jgi:hypothetical protein
MMGQQSRKESLFYYFRLEDQIPETHLLRLIDRYIDFSFVRDRLKGFYSPTGAPRLIRKSSCACCWSAIYTGSPASGGYWKTCACIWPIAGSPGWASTKRSPTTRRFPRTATGAFGSRASFGRCSSKSSGAAWPRAWWKAGT